MENLQQLFLVCHLTLALGHIAQLVEIHFGHWQDEQREVCAILDRVFRLVPMVPV